MPIGKFLDLGCRVPKGNAGSGLLFPVQGSTDSASDVSLLASLAGVAFVPGSNVTLNNGS
jgi:hypothetical protein